MKVKNNREHAQRKNVSEVYIHGVKNLDTGEMYFRRAQVVDISPTGLLFRVEREDLAAKRLREHLTLESLHGMSICFKIEVMDTYIECIVARTKFEGKNGYIVAVDFREDAPEYWRQCLVDLLPDRSGR